MTMIGVKSVATRLPAQDLERARTWYAEKLDLHPAEERPGGLRYVIGQGEFVVFSSSGASDGSFTQLAFTVEDLRAAMRELRSRGVVFMEYHRPPFVTRDGMAEIEGNYPSKGVRELGCWFLDSEGNMLGMGQSI
jgi:catechol 2,3-dioxygenase-like lactoylglutathione lyase family enzyme